MTNNVCLGLGEGLLKIFDALCGPGSRSLVLVAGGSCAGKTYLSDKLKILLERIGPSVVLVPLDRFFRDLDDASLPKDAQGRKLFDLPASYHVDEYMAAVGNLVRGEPVHLPCYDLEASKRIEGSGDPVGPARVVVAEGLFAIYLLAELFPESIKVYVEASEQVRLSRRILRDSARFGVSEEKIKSNYYQKVAPCHNRFVEPQKMLADFVIESVQKEEQ